MSHFKIQNSSNILVVLITCSRTRQRQKIEESCMEQLIKIVDAEKPNLSFMLFDNDSIYKEHLEAFAQIGSIFFASSNRGLWSAIHWVLKNESNIYLSPHTYIHIIESDLHVKSFSPLLDISEILSKSPNIHMARTQEFSVRASWRFNKKYSRLPYPLHIRRSEVDLENTSDFTHFQYKFITKLGSYKLYTTNLNAKLPGFHKMESLKKVIYELSKFESFSEKDFFRAYGGLSKEIAFLDSGIWYSLTDSKKNSKETGSYGDPLYLNDIGYQETRHSVISEYKDTEVIMHAAHKPV